MEIAVKAKLKHGAIVRFLEESGWTTKQLAEAVGTAHGRMSSIACLREVPGRELAERIALVVGRPVEEMWPEWASQMIREGLRVEATAFTQASPAMLAGLAEQRFLPAPQLEWAEARDAKKLVDEALHKLTPREEMVVRRHVLMGETLDRVGERLKLSRERVAQIRDKSISKITSDLATKRSYEKLQLGAAEILSVMRREGIELEPSGARWRGECPFCHKRSFSVDRKAQLFYCFECQIGGDVFKFIQERYGVSFGSAVAKLEREAPAR